MLSASKIVTSVALICLCAVTTAPVCGQDESTEQAPPGVDGSALDFELVWGVPEAKCRTNRHGANKCKLKTSFLVTNTGTQKAPEKSELRIYHSGDQYLTFIEPEVKRAKVGRLEPGQSKLITVKLKRAFTGYAGEYLIAVVDSDGDVAETNEDNNIIVSDPLP